MQTHTQLHSTQIHTYTHSLVTAPWLVVRKTCCMSILFRNNKVCVISIAETCPFMLQEGIAWFLPHNAIILDVPFRRSICKIHIQMNVNGMWVIISLGLIMMTTALLMQTARQLRQ